MKLLGWISLTLAFALALVAAGLRYAGGAEAPMVVMIAFGIALVVGLVALAISAAMLLAKGEVKLRPWDALKKAAMLFLIILGLRCLAWFVFPGLERNFGYELFQSAAFAALFALYTTAYRKPA